MATPLRFWSGLLAIIFGVTLASGCRQSPAETPSATLTRQTAPAPAASSTEKTERRSAGSAGADSETGSTPMGDVASDDYPRGLPLAEIEAPIALAPEHSPILTDVGRVDVHGFYAFRSADADAPGLDQPASGHLDGRIRQPLPEMLVVRTDPGAQVAFWAAALGTFATGEQGIVVQADADGLAQVQFRCGQDAGEYVVHAASPARSGTVTFVIDVSP